MSETRVQTRGNLDHEHPTSGCAGNSGGGLFLPGTQLLTGIMPEGDPMCSTYGSATGWTPMPPVTSCPGTSWSLTGSGPVCPQQAGSSGRSTRCSAHSTLTVTERHYINRKFVVPDYRAATERLAPDSGTSDGPALGL